MILIAENFTCNWKKMCKIRESVIKNNFKKPRMTPKNQIKIHSFKIARSIIRCCCQIRKKCDEKKQEIKRLKISSIASVFSGARGIRDVTRDSRMNSALSSPPTENCYHQSLMGIINAHLLPWDEKSRLYLCANSSIGDVTPFPFCTLGSA